MDAGQTGVVKRSNGTALAINGRIVDPAFTTPTDGQALAWSAAQSAFIPQTVSGSSTTLATAYSNGTTSADETLSLVSTKGGLIIKDNATPIGGTLFGVQSSGGTKFLNVTASGIDLFATGQIGTSSQGATNTTGLKFAGNVADGSSSSAFDFQNATATTSAQLMRFLRSTGAVSGQIELDTITTGSCVFRQPGTTYLAFLDSGNNGFKIVGGITTFRVGGGDFINCNSTNFSPANDAGTAPSLGSSANRWKRLYVAGTTIVAGDFALSAGWGTGAAVGTISASDNGGTFVVTSGTASTSANPTITLTFHDGTWTNAPNAIAKIIATSDAASQLAVAVTETTTATTLVITFNGTPAISKTFTFRFSVRGM